MAEALKLCRKCRVEQPIANFYRVRGRPTSPCKRCTKIRQKAGPKPRSRRVQQRERYHTHEGWANQVLYGCRYRAKKLGLPFNLELRDVLGVYPADGLCPVFRVPLIIGRRNANSPSIDRFVPALGYVRGNICIISHRANTIKRDASTAELKAVVNWMENRVNNPVY